MARSISMLVLLVLHGMSQLRLLGPNQLLLQSNHMATKKNDSFSNPIIDALG